MESADFLLLFLCWFLGEICREVLQSVHTLLNTLHSSSDKSKRRTKTVKKSAEPKWNQTFLYSHINRRDFRERMLEITVWDQPRVQEEESEFLGEVCLLQLFCFDSKISMYLYIGSEHHIICICINSFQKWIQWKVHVWSNVFNFIDSTGFT